MSARQPRVRKLQECIDNLDRENSAENRREFLRSVNKTMADVLVDKGRKQEAARTRRKILRLLLEKRFGPLPTPAAKTIRATKVISRLDDWLLQAIEAQTMGDLNIPGIK